MCPIDSLEHRLEVRGIVREVGKNGIVLADKKRLRKVIFEHGTDFYSAGEFNIGDIASGMYLKVVSVKPQPNPKVTNELPTAAYVGISREAGVFSNPIVLREWNFRRSVDGDRKNFILTFNDENNSEFQYTSTATLGVFFLERLTWDSIKIGSHALVQGYQDADNYCIAFGTLNALRIIIDNDNVLPSK